MRVLLNGRGEPSEPFFFDSVYSYPRRHPFANGGRDRARRPMRYLEKVRNGCLRATERESGAIGVRGSGVEPLQRFFTDPTHGYPRKHLFTNGVGVGPRRSGEI